MLREPFDQYSRKFYIQKLINGSFGDRVESIIDLGGHKGNTRKLFSGKKVTILDVYDESYEGYVKGDATKTAFDDATFDLATSFDVYEHIPRKKRKQFISEAVRISKLGVFITAPFDSVEKQTSWTEQAANDIYKHVHNTDHPWLKEHIEYKIPTQAEIETIFTQEKLYFCFINNNPLTNWLIMQATMFISSATGHDTAAVVDTNEWYNRHIEEFEFGSEESYRKIYFVSRDEKNVQRVKKTLEELNKRGKHSPQIDRELIYRAMIGIAETVREIMTANNYLKEKVTLLEDEVSDAIRNSQMLSKELLRVEDVKNRKLSNKIRTLFRK